MSLKKSLIAAIAAGALFFTIPAIMHQAFDMSDLVFITKVFLLLACAAAMWQVKITGGEPEKPGIYLPDIIMKMSILLAGYILLKSGFSIYREALIWKAVICFMYGLAVIFSFFCLVDKGGRQAYFSAPQYAPVKTKDVLLKLAVALGLSLLGIYFIKQNIAVCAILSFSGMLVQLYLVFRYRGSVKNAGADSGVAAPEQGNARKIFSALAIAAAFYIYYLSLKALWLYDIRTSMLLFVVGSAFFGLAPAAGQGKKEVPAEGDFNRFDIIYCGIIFLVSVAISSYKLMDIPPGIHGDETLSVKMALRMASGEKFHVVLEPDEYNGMTLLLYWLIIVLGKIGGINIVTGRWLSVLVGGLGPVFVYLIMKNLFSRRAGIMASVMLSCFFMQVFYSRNCLQWIFVPSLAAVSYYFFIKAMKNGSPLYFIAAGAFVSINLCFYSAAKASPFVIFMFLALMLLRKETRPAIIANWKGIFLMLAAMALVFSPVIDYIIHYPKEYFTRMSSVSYLKGLPSNYIEWSALAGNMVKNIQMYMTQSADGYCHNIPQKPFFDGFAAFAALLGLGFLFTTWKREASSFLIFWLFFGMLPGFLSHLGPEDPYPARTVLSIPAAVILAAMGVDRALVKIEGLMPRILKLVTPLAAAFFVVWFCFNSLRDYFVIFNNDPHTQVYYMMGEHTAAEHMIENKNELFRVTTRLGNNLYYNLMPGLDMSREKDSDVSILSLHQCYNEKKMDFGIIGEGIYYRTLPVYREYFPDAKVQTVWDRNFWMLDTGSSIKYCYGWKNPDRVIEMNKFMSWFYFYDATVNYALMSIVDIPWADIKEGFSLQAEFSSAGNRDQVRMYGNQFVYKKSFERAEISGLLDAPEYKKCEFKVTGADAKVFIDGRPAQGAVELYQGPHRLKVIFGKNASLNAALLWKPQESAAFTDVPRSSLINSSKIFGLLATYSREGKTIHKLLETAIDYRLYYELHRPAYAGGTIPYADIAWDGYLEMPEKGVYEFKMDTLFNARIEIDGKTVYTRKNEINDIEQIIKAPLDKGRHKIRISAYYHYISTIWGKGSCLRFMYKKPGHAEFGPVTYDMLAPY